MIISDEFRDPDDAFWERGIQLFEKRNRQRPFLVIEDETLYICDSLPKVLRHSDNAVVLSQWAGEYRSDWFRYTVAELKEHDRWS